MLSPFASQLYQIPKDLQVQLDSVGFAEVDQPMRSKHQVWVHKPYFRTLYMSVSQLLMICLLYALFAVMVRVLLM